MGGFLLAVTVVGVTVGVMVGGVGCQPAKLDSLPAPTPTPTPDPLPTTTPSPPDTTTPDGSPLVLVKTLANVRVQVHSPEEGQYGVVVYREKGNKRVPTEAWSVPAGWRPPGLQESRVVHAELLDTGDAIIVLFSLEKGLDLVYLPAEDFRKLDTSPQAIIFPETTPSEPDTTVAPGDGEIEQTTAVRQLLPKPEKIEGEP